MARYGKIGGVVLAAACIVFGLAIGATAAVAAGSAKDGSAGKTECVWSMDLDCALCHEREWTGIYGDDAAGGSEGAKVEDGGPADKGTDAGVAVIENYGAMHADRFSLECTSCHSDEEGMERGHAKLNSGKQAKRLKKTSVGSDVCLACHDQKDLAAGTAGLEVLIDNEGTVVNPHDLPDVADHTAIACTDCHKVHAGCDRTINQTAMATCTGCHHTGTFECGTCH